MVTCHKIENGPLENYEHLASLIHKVNVLLLEYESYQDLNEISKLIFTDRFLYILMNFCTNSDTLVHFALRLIEIMCLQNPIQVSNSGALDLVQGLLRSTNFDIIHQCLSLLSVLSKKLQTLCQIKPTTTKYESK